MNTKIKLVLILFLFITSIQAKVKVASVLGDNMVLQRNTEVQLWRTAQPSEKLSITTGWNSVKTKMEMPVAGLGGGQLTNGANELIFDADNDEFSIRISSSYYSNYLCADR